MANFTAGTGATLKSSTLENALLELVTFVKIEESDLTKNPNALDNVTVTIDYDGLKASGDFTFPINVNSDGAGNLVVTGSNYLTGTAYKADTGNTATLKSANPIGALMELMNKLQALESSSTKNPQAKNYILSKTDLNAYTYTGNFELDLILSISLNGSVQVAAKEYLSS